MPNVTKMIQTLETTNEGQENPQITAILKEMSKPNAAMLARATANTTPAKKTTKKKK
jgi:hypothetical protein